MYIGNGLDYIGGLQKLEKVSGHYLNLVVYVYPLVNTGHTMVWYLTSPSEEAVNGLNPLSVSLRKKGNFGQC